MDTVPMDLKKVLAANAAAKAKWDTLTSIGRRDFISWIASAKQPETRKRRVDSVPSRLASGKRRPCCYAVVPMVLYRELGTNAKAKSAWSKLSPDEKRDFNDWVAAATGRVEIAARTKKAVAAIAAGKKRV